MNRQPCYDLQFLLHLLIFQFFVIYSLSTVVFSSTETNAKINLIDMNLKEVRLQFRTEASVGVGNGMLYCNAVDIIDTQITGAPPEYSTPIRSTFKESQNSLTHYKS